MAEGAQKRAQETYPEWFMSILNKIGLGSEDPAEAGMGMLNPVGAGVMPAVSIFAKQGMGGTAVRKEMTESALASLKSTLEAIGATPDQIAKAIQVATKYPRVLAHTLTRPMTAVEAGMKDSGLARFSPRGSGLAGTGEISLKAHSDPAHSVAHELTHAAQNVSRKSRFTPEYNEAESILRETGGDPYWDNPFEVNARATADRKVPLGMDPSTDPIMADINQFLGRRRTPGPTPATQKLTRLRQRPGVDGS